MRYLDDAQLELIAERITEGYSNSELLKIVQQEFGIAPKQDARKLAVDLVKFKAKISAPAKQVEEIPAELRAKISKLSEKVDGLGRMGWLINIQTERVINILNKEKMGLPLSVAHSNIKTLGGLLDKYIKTQIELGMLNKEEEEHLETMSEQFDTVLQMISGNKDGVTEATRKLLQAIDKKAERYRLNDDGSVEKAPNIERIESDVHRETISSSK